MQHTVGLTVDSSFSLGACGIAAGHIAGAIES
jgi:hypothetical protein